MMASARFDLCVIGAGSGGLSVVAGAVQMGASVVLVESGRMGGDCLNFGCVPSKSLLAAARAVEAVRRSDRFGIDADVRAIGGERVFEHVRGVIAAIAPHDSVERFRGLGATVINGRARFVAPDTIEANGRRIRARRFVVATGSSPLIPPVPGLDSVPFLTNETLFDLTDIPARLLVIGGGPIGIEMAQAFRELGAEVTVIEQAAILPRDDPELVAVVRRHLAALGVVLLERAQVTRVSAGVSGLAATVFRDGAEWRVDGSHLLIAVGRRPDIADLDLEAAGVACERDGITVDRRLRTSNHRIYAVGDVVAGAPRFTHVAGYHAGIVLRNALFRWPAQVDYRAVPHVTYTHPELAHVGSTQAQATAGGHDPVVLRVGFADNDRAQTERSADGLVKVVADRRGRILGAGIVGCSAGELIQTWVLAISRRLHIGAVATMVAPYPTLGEASKRAAAEFYAPRLFSPRTRWFLRLLARLG